MVAPNTLCPITLAENRLKVAIEAGEQSLKLHRLQSMVIVQKTFCRTWALLLGKRTHGDSNDNKVR